MNRYFKDAVIFSGGVTGGFVLCGVVVIKKVLTSESLRPAVVNIISDKISKVLFGETKQSHVSYVSYSRYRNGVDNIVVETRTKAEKILSQLDDVISTYGHATVADLYDLAGISSKYKDCGCGWTDIRNASITRTRAGYLIDLPRTIPLKQGG